MMDQDGLRLGSVVEMVDQNLFLAALNTATWQFNYSKG
jgi:hypothetical protein